MATPEYVTVETFQWSLGLLITAVCGCLVTVFTRLWGIAGRKEIEERFEALLKRIKDDVDERDRRNIDMLHRIELAIQRLEEGYFRRGYKGPEDHDR